VRRLIAYLLIYLLFLVQASLPAWWPDLMLAMVIACAFHETRLASTLLGAFAGLCADMTAPAFAGAGLLAYALAGYGVASVRRLFYRARWAALLLGLAALVLKWLTLYLVGPGLPSVAPILVSSCLTLLLVPVADAAVGRLLYPGWQAA
jgi:rod shape-determining protein MreD